VLWKQKGSYFLYFTARRGAQAKENENEENTEIDLLNPIFSPYFNYRHV